MMSMKNWKCAVLVGVAAIIAVLAANGVALATAIQFDFGSMQGAYTGTDAPAALGASQSTWQTLGSAGGNGVFNVTSGLVYADGSAATGVWIIDGTSPDHANTWTWGSGTIYGSGGTFAPSCGPTALMGDYIHTSNNEDLGVKVGGLAAGTYDVYAMVTDSVNRSFQLAIGVNNSDVTSGSLAVQEDTSINTWTPGVNYVVQRVTVGSTSDYIGVLMDSNYGSNPSRWTALNGLQIVKVVPEPGTFAILAAGVMGLIAYAWRKRK